MQAANASDAIDFGAIARQAMIAIFTDRDPTAVDRFFSEVLVQHDPDLADGEFGLRAFATEIAKSPKRAVKARRIAR